MLYCGHEVQGHVYLLNLTSQQIVSISISSYTESETVPVNEELALTALDAFDDKWGKKYPKIGMSWRKNWAELSTYFKYPEAVRTLIYTTNRIENYNRQLRKVTKNKGVFPNDNSLFKMLYLVTCDITKKWTGKVKHWGQSIADRVLHLCRSSCIIVYPFKSLSGSKATYLA